MDPFFWKVAKISEVNFDRVDLLRSASKFRIRKVLLMSDDAVNGINSLVSSHSVDETIARLRDMLHTNGVTVFALIDHSGEAEKAGLSMPSTKLLIFGNPKAGTPVMLASPSAAIDLPLKILVAEDGNGQVTVSWSDADYLRARHHIPAELLKNIAAAEALALRAAR